MSQIKVEYGGQFYIQLMKLLSINDNYTIGEKLTVIEKTAKKRFYELTDKELYETLMYIIETKDYFNDEVYTEEEFKTWIENVTVTE